MTSFDLATAEYTVSMTYTPTTVYGSFNIPRGWKVVDFRQYKKGEKYLTHNGVVTAPCDEAINGIPYIILEKIPVKTIFTYEVIRRDDVPLDNEWYSDDMEQFFKAFGCVAKRKYIIKRIVEYL